MWEFASRRGGDRYKADEISDYLNNVIIAGDGDMGDLVLHNVVSSPPYEIRMDYVINTKLPEELNAFYDYSSDACKAKYRNHWFTLLYSVDTNTKSKYLLIKFTLEDGRNDCTIKYASIFELAEEDVKVPRRGFFDFSDPMRECWTRANNAIQRKKGRKLRIPASVKSK